MELPIHNKHKEPMSPMKCIYSVVNAVDWFGNKLADCLGITSPRYEMYLKEYIRRKDEGEETSSPQQLQNAKYMQMLDNKPSGPDAVVVQLPPTAVV